MDGASCPLLPETRNWGRGPSAPHQASRTCGHIRGAPGKEGASASFSSETQLPLAETPTPGLSRRPRPSGLLRRKGGDSTHGGEAGRRKRGGRIPRPGRSELEPIQARRHPPRPGGSGPASPPAASRPPRWPRAPARPPRAPRRSRSRPRTRAHRTRAPSLPAGPGAQRPKSRRPRRHPALTRCLGRRFPARRPRRSEGCSARPSLSPPQPARIVSLQPP